MRAILFAGLLALGACNAPAPEPSSAAAVATPAAEPVAERPTYQATPEEAAKRWQVVADLAPPVGDQSDGDCTVRMARELSVRLCNSQGRLSTMIVTLRGQSSTARLNQALYVTASIIAPDAEPSDLTRIQREAAVALQRGGGMLCPSTRCFRVIMVGDAVMISADANS